MKKKIKVILLIVAVAAFLAITIPRFLFTNGLPADDKVFNAKEFNTIMGGAYSEARYNRGMSGTKCLENVFADHEKAIFTAKNSKKNLPTGPLTPKIYNKKNPTTVGGSTIGNVKIPSSTIFIVSFFIFTMPQATINPTKKVIKIDKLAVFIEMKTGDQSTAMSYLL